MGVNLRVYSADLLRQSIVGAETASEPIELLTLTDGYYANVAVDYHQGLRSPHLSGISGKPDLLTAILQPRRTD
jgi:hypothetical protein